MQSNNFIKICLILFCFYYTVFFTEQKLYAQYKMVYPFNNTTIFERNIRIKFDSYALCQNYNIQISKDEIFNEVIFSTISINNFIDYTFDTTGIFYIRLKPICMSKWEYAKVEVLNKNDLQPFVENWFSADSNITITSGRVSRWGDMLDNSGNFASQSNNNNRPLLQNQVSLLNNKTALIFKPSNIPTFLNLNSEKTLESFTIMALYSYNPSNTSLAHFLITGTRANGLIARFPPTNGFGIFSNKLGGVNQSIIEIEPNLNDSVFGIYSATNNVLLKNERIVQSSGVITDSLRYSRIGARVDQINFNFQGLLAEFIVFKKELLDNEITLFHNYFYSKYAPRVNLGNDTIVGNSFTDSLILNASNRFIKYLWTTGDSTQTIKITTSGKYGVWATDVFGRTSYDELNVFPYNRLDNDTVYICNGSSININLQLNDNLFDATWIDNNSNSTNRTIADEGTYIVRITDQFNREIFDTITVLLDNFTFNFPLSINSINACLNDSIILLVNTGIDTIHWSNNSTLNKYPVLTNEQVIVYAKSYIGCEYRDTFNINIAGEKPFVDFEIGNILCEKQNVLLTDASFAPFGNSITNWDWNFSDTTTSNLQNPEKIFQSSGSKSIKLKVTTNVGCFDEVEKSIILNKKPKAQFDNLLACAGNPTQFRDFSIPNADSVQSWNWNFNNLGTSIQKNPSFEFPSVGLYHVFLKSTNTNNCFDTITKPVGINPSPSANFTSDSTACTNTIITFNNTATAPFPLAITAFNWFFGDGAQDNFLNNTSHTYTNNGSYNVKLAVRANNQCVDTVTKKINVYAKPNVDFNVSNNKCIGQAIQFSDASTVSDNTTMSNWSWLFGGLGSSNQQNPSFVFAEQGNYTVQLNAGTSKGCSSIKVKNVTVTDPPLVDFSFTPTAGLPPLNVSFTNLSPAGSTFTWNYGDGSPNYVGFNSPTYTYNTIGNFPIQLSASNFLGCTNTVTKYIIVGSANVDVELLDVIPIQNNDYYKVLLNIRNNSNIPIYNLGLTIRLGNGTLIRETWNGVLLPNQTLAYNFTGEVRYNGTTDIPIICANIETINFNSTDDNLENNSSCKDFKIGDFNILTLYPNPTDNNINVGIMIPETGDLQINVYNYLGQQLFQQNMNASTGYNLINLDLSLLHAASYIIEAKYDDKVVRKPILKRQ
jgi:PKD repeat protein